MRITKQNWILTFTLPILMLSWSCELLNPKKDNDDNLLLIGGYFLLNSNSCTSSTFKSSSFRNIRSANKVACTLSDGSSIDCCQISFGSNTISNKGPFCPVTATSPASNAGMGFYDGTTTPGLHEISLAFLNNMENDGSDIVLGANATRILDPNNTSSPSFTYCLEPAAKENLNLTFIIPLNPKEGTTSDSISSEELLGVSLDGLPFIGRPPTITGNNGNLAALDSCGGHHATSGYYHLHFIPESINGVHTANTGSGANFGTNSLSCSNFTQNTSALTGFAKDGYPIYASKDSDGSTPTNLDSCNGHTTATMDFPDGVYHYHAKASSIPNLPSCLKGVSVTEVFNAQ